MPSLLPASPDSIRLARELSARLAGERPDLLPLLGELMERIKPYRAGPGFACVFWFGANYSFTPNQAKVVEILWRAWEGGTPDVYHNMLLNAADLGAERLVDVFKGSAAWGTLIVPGQVKGTFRLQEPPNEA